MENNLDLDASFFMGTALLAANISTSTASVGACIVNDKNQIVGIGYNITGECHAEVMAIENATKSLKDCTVYVTLYPCNTCAKAIYKSGIKKVIYDYDNFPIQQDKLLIVEYGIEIEQFAIPKRNMNITFAHVANYVDEKYMNGGITWDHFFMAIAYLIVDATKCDKQCGAVIVHDNKIIGIGYKTSTAYESVTDAEINAIKNSGEDVKDCTMYVTVHPCTKCMTAISESKIKQVYYNFDKFEKPPKITKDGVEFIHYQAPCNFFFSQKSNYFKTILN